MQAKDIITKNIAYSLVNLVVMATYLRLQNNACNSYPK